MIRVDVQAPGLDSGVGARGCCSPPSVSYCSRAPWCWPTGWADRSCVRWRTWPTRPARWALLTGSAYRLRCRVPRRYGTWPRRSTASSGRVEVLLERERQSVADLSHRLRTPMTALRLRVESVADPAERERLTGDLDELQSMVDHVVREARRSEREGLVAGTDGLAVLAERAEFWRPLAEDQDRVLRVDVTGSGPVRVRASAADLLALLDALMDNVFTHTDDGVAVRVSISPRAEGGLVLVVEDDGPGYPEGLDVTRRGTSGAGSTGLGMSIVAATAAESGGRLVLGRTPTGGARAEVTLGPPV